jgi:hypothetical protein
VDNTGHGTYENSRNLKHINSRNYIHEDKNMGAERVLGFVIKDKPSVETTHERLSKLRILPHIVVS